MFKIVRIAGGIILLVIAIFILYNILCSPVRATYDITANTEYLSFSSPGGKENSFALQNANIMQFSDSLDSAFVGELVIREGTDVIFERVGEGPLSISLQITEAQMAKGSDGVIAVAEYANSNRQSLKIKNNAEIFLEGLAENYEKGIGLTIPFRGAPLIGHNLYEANLSTSTGALLNGTVSAYSQSFLSGERYTAMSFELLYGQSVSLSSKGSRSKGTGVIAITSDPGMKVIFTSNADYAVLERSGPGTMDLLPKLKPTVLDRFLQDRSLQIISILAGAIIVIFTIINFFIDTTRWFKRRSV